MIKRQEESMQDSIVPKVEEGEGNGGREGMSVSYELVRKRKSHVSTHRRHLISEEERAG